MVNIFNIICIHICINMNKRKYPRMSVAVMGEGRSVRCISISIGFSCAFPNVSNETCVTS